MEDLQGQENVEAPIQEDIDTAQINEWITDNVPQDEAEVEVDQQEFDADPEVPLEVVPPPEDEPELEAAAPEKETSTSKAFLKQAKKERELQAQREELKKMQDELRPFMDAKKAAESGDMLGAMNQVGWNYEQATNQVLNDGKPQQQNQALNPELEKRLSAFEESQKKQQIDNYLANLKNIVDSDDNYQLIRSKWDDTVPMILQLQEIEAKESGKLRDHNNLLDDIEKYYEDIVISLAGSAKLSDKIGLKDAAQSTPQETPSDNSPRKRPRTLRNSVSRPSPPATREPKTRRERIEAALAVFDSQGRSA